MSIAPLHRAEDTYPWHRAQLAKIMLEPFQIGYTLEAGILAHHDPSSAFNRGDLTKQICQQSVNFAAAPPILRGIT